MASDNNMVFVVTLKVHTVSASSSGRGGGGGGRHFLTLQLVFGVIVSHLPLCVKGIIE